MNRSLEDVLARLQGGADLKEVLGSLYPEASRLTSLASITRRFDRGIYENIFKPAYVPDADLTFDSFVSGREIEGLARPKGWYRSKRQFSSDSELGKNAELSDVQVRRLHEELAGYFSRLGDEADLDVLYHTLGFDAEKAGAMFDRAFETADKSCNLARCYDLLDVLQYQAQYLTPGLSERLTDLYAYVRTRSEWEDEFFRTARYFEREEVHRHFHALLEEKAGWMLQLFGTGGMGKTMFLRWAIARYCIPAPQRIPVARIDFDISEHVEASREGFLMLAKLAEQLNGQVPGSPFSELLSEVSEYVLTAGANPRSAVHYAERLAVEIPDRFISGLNSIHEDPQARVKPVVLILDTLEEALLRYETDLADLLKIFENVHESCPQVRLILSGRYDLRERFPSEVAMFGEDAVHFEFLRFSEEEARRYLTFTRRQSESRPLDAVIQRAEGLPFKLALFADLLDRDVDITAEEIFAYPSVDLMYLIRRIVQRIEDRKVRLLLRYGIVPRRLSLAFLTDVIAVYLPGVIAGDAAYDDLTAGLPEEDQQVFLEEKGALEELVKAGGQPEAYEKLWQSLNKFASGYSWVRPVDDEQGSLVFHNDVVAPMRELLRRHLIYALLHEAAIRHFEKLAEEQPNQWSRWAREIVYHHFQIKGIEARNIWIEWVEKALASGEPQPVIDLGGEVLGSEYLDDDGKPLAWKSERTIIDEGIMRNARYLVAWGNYLFIKKNPNSITIPKRWQALSQAFEQAEGMTDVKEEVMLSLAQRALLKVSLLYRTQQYNSAFTFLQQAVAGIKDDVDAREVYMLWGQGYTEVRQHQKAADIFQKALGLARAGDALQEPLQLQMAESWALCGKVGEAARLAKSLVETSRDTHGDLEFRLLLGRVCLKDGMPTEAWRLFREQILKRNLSPASYISCDFGMARAALERFDPEGAMEACNRAFERMSGPEKIMSGADYDRFGAEGTRLRGLIFAAQMGYEEALGQLEKAQHRYVDIGNAEIAFLCLLDRINVQYYGVGDLNYTDDLLQQAKSTSMPSGSELRADLLRYEAALHAARGNVDGGGDILINGLIEELRRDEGLIDDKRSTQSEGGGSAKELIDAIEEMLPTVDDERSFSDLLAALSKTNCNRPFVRISLAIEGLVRVNHPGRLRFAAFLIQGLGALDSATARLTALEDLHRFPEGEALPEFAGEKLLRVIGEDAAKRIDEKWDRCLLLRIEAAVNRVAGRPDRAEKLLERAIKDAMSFKGDSLYAMCGLLEESNRLKLAIDNRDRRKIRDWTLKERIPEGVQGRIMTAIALMELSEDGGSRNIEYALQHGEEALKLMSVTIKTPTHWHSATALVFAEILRAAGKYEDARSHAAFVRGVYSRLGNSLRAETVEARFFGPMKEEAVEEAIGPPAGAGGAGDDAAGAPPSMPEPAPPVSAAPVPPASTEPPAGAANEPEVQDTLFVTLRWDESKKLLQTAYSPPRAGYANTEGLLNKALSEKTASEIFPYSMVKAAVDRWPELSDELRRVLIGDRGVSGFGEIKILGLSTAAGGSAALPALPWELAPLGFNAFVPVVRVISPPMHEMQRVVWLQRALNAVENVNLAVDGRVGPATQGAIDRYRKSNALVEGESLSRSLLSSWRIRQQAGRKPLVLFVRTDIEEEVTRGRVSSQSAGYQYREMGMEVNVIEEDHVSRLTRDLQQGVPYAVIHLSVTLKESSSLGAVHLDFDRFEQNVFEKRSKMQQQVSAEPRNVLTASVLDRLLKGLPAGVLRPTVILDVPRPRGTTELVRQLFMRNIFASELFAHGAVSAVLATGLTPPDRREKWEYQMIQRLSSGEPLLSLFESVSKEFAGASTDIGALIGPAASALFTADPRLW